jgi:hypothetical protein
MTDTTEAPAGAAGREVAETAALLAFVGSGISAVLFFCVSASGGAQLAALLGMVALAGLTASMFCLHRLGRNATRCG